ncbi:Major_facilitator superfamily protein [Hexamita inflata]|uniref:Major facilitator superfamily protein n=1 Tax=Hexamita inflata TaxID=28002 RepID=A0AA86R0Z1_9EUKA|nr:Major facilitator superfamily protein [Hexamita inflata]
MSVNLSQQGIEYLQKQQLINSSLIKLFSSSNTKLQEEKDILNIIQTTNIIQLLVGQMNNTSQSIDVVETFVPQQTLQSQVDELSSKIGYKISLVDNYQQMLDLIFEVCQYLQLVDSFKIREDVEFTDQDKQLILRHIPQSLVISDINTSNNSKITSKLWILYTSLFFASCGLTFIVLNIQLYILNELGGSSLDSTLFQTYFSLGQLFGSPILHAVSDRFGRRIIYQLSIFMYTLSSGLMLLSKMSLMGSFALHWLYLMRALQGFFAVLQPLAFTIISESVAPASRPKAFIWNNLVFMCSGIVVTVLNAFVIPHIPNAFPEDAYIVLRSSILSALVFYFIGFVFGFYIQETAPYILLRREFRRLRLKYGYKQFRQTNFCQKSGLNQIKAVFSQVFVEHRNFFLFLVYLLGFGTGVMNQSVSQVFYARLMDGRTLIQIQSLLSIHTFIGIGVMFIFSMLFYQKLVSKIGQARVIAVMILCPVAAAGIRSTAAPVNQYLYALSVVFNQFGMTYIDAPIINYVSMKCNVENKAQVLGIFQVANSIARCVASVVGGALYDWHWRNGSQVMTWSAFTGLLCLGLSSMQ